MNIVVLDGFTLNPGDLSWEELAALGTCQVHDRTGPGETMARAAEAEILLTNKTLLSRELIEDLPRLKYIGVLATGTNVVDLEAARKRGIPVTNVPAYGTQSVAQATLALMLELTNHVGHHSNRVREGAWTASPDWCFWDKLLIELAGLTLGIVGYGRIGKAVAGLGAALGMEVVAHSPSRGTRPDNQPSLEVRFVELEALFRQCDVVSLHCPLTPQTRDMVNAQSLSWMKRTAYLINTSRGALVDEQALADALNSGRIAGAGLDVLSLEPPSADNPLLRAANCIITPHCAWATHAARARLMNLAVANVRAFVLGKPQNVVNA